MEKDTVTTMSSPTKPLSLSLHPGGSDGKASAYRRETQVQSLGREDHLEEKMGRFDP